MPSQFNFNESNTRLDKKLRNLREGNKKQKIIIIGVIVIIAIIILVMVISNAIKSAEEAKNQFKVPTSEQIKQGIGNTAEDIKQDVGNSIRDFFSTN